MKQPEFRRLVPVPDGRGAGALPASDLVGVDHEGRVLTVSLAGPSRTLLFFLSAECDGCLPLWERAGTPGAWGMTEQDRVVIVTRDPGRSGPTAGDYRAKVEDPARVAALSPPGSTVVYTSAAWRDFRVTGPPFFVLVDGASGRVLTEGVAWGPEQIKGHLADALTALEGR